MSARRLRVRPAGLSLLTLRLVAGLGAPPAAALSEERQEAPAPEAQPPLQPAAFEAAVRARQPLPVAYEVRPPRWRLRGARTAASLNWNALSLPPAPSPSAPPLLERWPVGAPGEQEQATELGQSDYLLANAAEFQHDRLQVENDRLREENARLQSKERQLSAPVQKLAKMRSMVASLRGEKSRLQRRMSWFASSLASARRSPAEDGRPVGGGGDLAFLGRGSGRAELSHGAGLVLAGLAGVLLLFMSCFVHFNNLYHASQEEDSDSDDDWDEDEEAEIKLRHLVSNKQSRRCPLCWCCCNTGVMMFFGSVLVVTILGGAVLWKTGILQPILSQCLMYVYITVIVAGFVSLMISQLWQLVGTLVGYIIKEFQKLKGVFNIFGKKKKDHKRPDFLDDGELNSAYRGPLVGGRPRAPLARPSKEGRDHCVQS